MATITINFDLIVLYMVAANVIAILAYVLFMKEKTRRVEQNIARITTTIIDYFQHGDISIRVECISRFGGKRFVAIIESKPLKRFRYSHIVEINLCNHIEQTCGLILEKVYWRFPVSLSPDSVMSTENANEDSLPLDIQDEYINEQLLQQKAKDEYSVKPATWRQFEEAVKDMAKQAPEIPPTDRHP
jgi:hypothetical protein